MCACMHRRSFFQPWKQLQAAATGGGGDMGPCRKVSNVYLLIAFQAAATHGAQWSTGPLDSIALAPLGLPA